ncbi:MAG: pilus assembly protein PilM [Chloroflexi bacterium]|nr:pilus assembly protein PilM [Chloroflexota bacterium]
MASLLQLLLLKGVPLVPTSRLIAIDPGSHCLKLLLTERFLGRVRCVREETIDFREEVLLSPAEFNRHLQSVLREMGPYPIALSLPQHLSMSEVIDLPPTGAEDVKDLIEDETVKLSGLSESAIVYDYVPLQPFGRHHNPFWVTLAQEGDILAQINRMVLPHEELCDVTTTANALMAAYQAVRPYADRVVLVDLGANSTVVVILLEGQGVFAGSFPMGGDLFTETIAAQKGCAFEIAESSKRTDNLLEGKDELAGFKPVVDGWQDELARVLKEWMGENPEVGNSLASFDLVLGGGGARQPGLLEYLRRRGQFSFTLWPAAKGETSGPGGQFAVAYGTALQALRRNVQSASLLPDHLRENWKRQRSLQRIQSVNFLLLAAVALALAFGTWQKLALVSQKKALLAQARTALEKARMTDLFSGQLAAEYERVRPILKRQEQTWDTLRTLSLLQQVKSNRSLWFVLLADQQSYFSSPPWVAPTNAASTNQVTLTNLQSLSNLPPVKQGFIAEVCLPDGDGEALRHTLSQLVADLKQEPIFGKVDSLSVDRRRNLVDPNLLLADRNFTFQIELADKELQRAAAHHEPAGQGRLVPASAEFKTNDAAGTSRPHPDGSIVPRPGPKTKEASPEPAVPSPIGRDSKSLPRSFRQKLERQVSSAAWEDRQ